MTNPAIKQRLAILSPEYRAFILSEYPNVVARTFGESLGFDEIKTTVLENGIVLFLLIFLNKEELIAFIATECHISEKESSELIAAIQQTLPDQFLKELTTLYSKLRTLDPDVLEQAIVQNTSENTQMTQNTVDTTLTNMSPSVDEEPVVQPLRTMEEDVDKIHGYGAYRKIYPDGEAQSDIPNVEPSTLDQQPPVSEEERVVQATPQEEMLGEKPPLAPTPTYTEPK
ncbi:hypothetical protein N8083_01935 [Candidatus Pacebacteria bacterium]|nr:hypothetical protein [Candidatus Paceibacterota bacterium]